MYDLFFDSDHLALTTTTVNPWLQINPFVVATGSKEATYPIAKIRVVQSMALWKICSQLINRILQELCLCKDIWVELGSSFLAKKTNSQNLTIKCRLGSVNPCKWRGFQIKNE